MKARVICGDGKFNSTGDCRVLIGEDEIELTEITSVAFSATIDDVPRMTVSMIVHDADVVCDHADILTTVLPDGKTYRLQEIP